MYSQSQQNMNRFILTFSFIIVYSALFSQQKSAPTATTEKFNTLLYYIENMYVDTVNSEKLVETAIIKMLEEMDPHSTYIPKEEMSEVNEPLNGNFEGIGVQFNILKDTIFIVSPISGGPSEKLGIMAGDKIIEIDGVTVAGTGITNDDVMKKLKGPKGTHVKVGIQRKGLKELIEFDIERDKIPIYSVDASYLVEPGIGYIKVNRFAKTTLEELRTALTDLNKQGMQSLILDLQGNGGGLLNASIEMADEFLSGNKLIVYTEGRAFPKDETLASKDGLFEKGKLVVLIDEGSASASEIVSGAIQDWDRGIIVGRRSFGKGLVQRPVTLPDGSMVRLTVQKYFTPTGRCIQKPYDEGSEAYHKERYERFEKGELFNLDSLHLPDSLKYFTKYKKRVVYGGGGILPDIFVPVDTSYSSEYFSNLIRKGVINSWALTYVDKNRPQLQKQFSTIKSFISGFKMSASMHSELLSQAEKEEIVFNEEEYQRSKYAIELRIKALIGRNLFENGDFYRIINDMNPAFKKGLEILKDGTFDRMKIADNG